MARSDYERELRADVEPTCAEQLAEAAAAMDMTVEEYREWVDENMATDEFWAKAAAGDPETIAYLNEGY